MKDTLNVATPTDRTIVITRVFNVKRALVWEAMSRPERLRQWLFGPPGWAMTVCDDDLRAGGKFRWAWRGPSGEEMAMSGAYREVVAPARIVRTESFEFGCAPQSGEQLATMELVESGDKTQLTITVLYPSQEARDGAVASGMDQGMAAGYDCLDELLAANP